MKPAEMAAHFSCEFDVIGQEYRITLIFPVTLNKTKQTVSGGKQPVSGKTEISCHMTENAELEKRFKVSSMAIEFQIWFFRQKIIDQYARLEYQAP